MSKFPYGYTKDSNGVMGMGTMLTRQELEAKQTVYKLNPEMWRRSIALFEFAESRGVPLGPGTGWRIQPNPPPPGFAPPGKSNHEGFPADGVTGGAVAIDTVPEPSWAWMEQNCAAYGLRTFKNVNSEPWHIQPIDIPASRTIGGVVKTTPWNLPVWPLPVEEEVDVPLTQDEINKIAEAVWAKAIDTTNADSKVDPQPARFLLQRTFLMVSQYLGSYGGKPMEEYRPSMLKQILDSVKGKTNV